MKKLSLICLLGIVIIISAATCKKGNPCTQTNQYFEFGIKAIPNYDSIKVNDTIWTVIDESVNLLDKGTNTIVDFSNAVNLTTYIAFQKAKFEPSLDFIASTATFNFLLVEGVETNNTNPNLLREYRFLETNGKYKLKLGIVPRDTGIFRILFGNAANVYRKTSGCTNAFFEMNFKETNQHRYLIPGYGGNTVKGGDYYFKVK